MRQIDSTQIERTHDEGGAWCLGCKAEGVSPSLWERQLEALLEALALDTTIDAFEEFQESLVFDARLQEARDYERSRRPLLRAHFATGHPIGCACEECFDAREERPIERAWPGPARSQHLNGR